MAMDGVAIAPLLFLICENVTLLAIKLVMGGYGRRLGTSMIDKLSEKMGVISEAASMIGVTVIAGLAATFVKMNVAITFSAGAIEEGVNGVVSAADSTQVLVTDMDNISRRMDENYEIADGLRKETAIFIKL